MDIENIQQRSKFDYRDTCAVLEGLAGIGLLALFAYCCLMQIQTTEAAMLGQRAMTSFTPNWAIFMQLKDLFSSSMSIAKAQSILVGWFIELFYLAAAFNHRKAILSVKNSHEFITKGHDMVTIGILVINAWTDYNYGLGDNNVGGQILFAIIMTLGTAIGGNVGLKFFIDAVSSLFKK